MKVVNYEHHVTCECGAILEYTPSDIGTGALGVAYVTCPECLANVDIDGTEYNKRITTENVLFPDDFYNHSDGADISKEDINEWIQRCISSCKSNDCWKVCSFLGSGDSIVFAFKFEDEYVVYVAKKHYEISIPRELY